MPTQAQYFFASRWLNRIIVQVIFLPLLVGFPLCFAYAKAVLLARAYSPLSEIWNLLRVGFFVLIALMLGFLIALVAASLLAGILWLLYHPLYKARCVVNGAPFVIGDQVRILVGRHKNRIVRIYGTWRDDSVRVELSKAEEQKFDDIFTPIELLREDGKPANIHPTSSAS